MKFQILSTLALFAFGFSACKPNQKLKTVDVVDLNRYAGLWFEIALLPNSFEKGCSCTTARYTVKEGYVEVNNVCNKSGKISDIKGKAFPVKGSNNSKLKVQFFWPFKGDYYIMALADDYSVALVGHPNRKYLWILSRSKTLEKSVLENYVEIARNEGFEVDKLHFPKHDCKEE